MPSRSNSRPEAVGADSAERAADMQQPMGSWFQSTSLVFCCVSRDVQGQLPSGILGPVVNDEFSDVDSILYMMTGDGADYAQLKKVSEGFRQRLLKVPGVTIGRRLRQSGRAHLRRIQPRQARHARHHAAGAVRFARQAEQRV